MNAGGGEETEYKIQSCHTLCKKLPLLSPLEEIYKEATTVKNQAFNQSTTTLIETVAKGETKSIKDAVNTMFNRVCDAAAQVDRLSVNDALKDCFVVFCIDGAEHDNTVKNKSNIITY